MATRIQTYKPEDIKLIRTRPMFTNFGTTGQDDYVEMHIMSGDNVLESNYNVEGWSILKSDTKNSSPTIKLNIHDDIRSLGYRSGTFNVQYNFFRKVVGDNINSLIVDEISTSRKEIRVRPKDPNNIAIDEEFLAFGRKDGDPDRKDIEVDFYRDVRLNFGEGTTALAVNWMVDYKVFPEYPHSIVIKLYEELPDGIEEKDELWIVKAVIESVIEPIIVEYIPPGKRPYMMAPADFSIPLKYDTASPTGFESWNTLLNATDDTKNKIISRFFSGSLGDVRLNFDFNMKKHDFSNLVHFGSAVDRLENFKYKLQLIELYDSKIAQLSTNLAGLSDSDSTGSFEFTTNVSKYKTLKTSLIGTFDEIEDYMYYESASTQGTSSYGDFWPLSWPKETAVEPYRLAPTTSSKAQEWYGQITDKYADYYETGVIYSASLFDKFNDNALATLIPEHIRRDEQNNEYGIFVNMVAQHYDYLYFYIKSLLDIHKRDNPLYEGLSKDLLKPVLESFGWYPHQGFDFEDLWQHVLGTDESGSFGSSEITYTPAFTQSVTYANNSQVSQSFSKEEISKELWKRILNNLPGLLKTKGTKKSIRALISAYGLPSTILKIYEYGGPQKLPGRHSKTIYDRYSYSLNMDTDSSITGSWAPSSESRGRVSYPNTVELRFNIPDREDLNKDMLLWNTYSGSLGIWLEHTSSHVSKDTGSKYGRVSFGLRSGSEGPQGIHNYITASTGWAPLYNNDWWNVMLTRKEPSFEQTTGYAFTESVNILDHEGQDLRYNLVCKKMSDFATFGRISWAVSASIDISGSLGEPSKSYNRSWGGASSIADSTATPIIDMGIEGTLKHFLGGATDTYAGDNLIATSASYGAERTLEPFSGSMQEFRIWQTALTESVFDYHVQSPISIAGNYITASYDDLLVRWSLGADLNRYEVSHSMNITSSHPSQLKRMQSGPDKQTTDGYLYGFSSTPGEAYGYSEEEERYFTLSPRNIGASPYSEKIRIEDNRLKGNLSVDNKVEQSSFDRNPLDSNRLGIFFSPVDEIDLDIAHEFGPFAFDDYVGDPSDEFKPEYKPLRDLRTAYFKKYFGNPTFSDYLYILKYLDDSLFRTVRQLLPARANAQVGLLIRPHFLERPKMQTNPSVSVAENNPPPTIQLEATVPISTSLSNISAGEVGPWEFTGTKNGKNNVGRRESGYTIVPSQSNYSTNKSFSPKNDYEHERGLDNRTVGEFEADIPYTIFGYDVWLRGSRYIHTNVKFAKTGSAGTGPNGANVWNPYYERDGWGMTIHTPPHGYLHQHPKYGKVGYDYDNFTASSAGDVTDGFRKWGLDRKANSELYVPFISQSRKSFEKYKALHYYANEKSQSLGKAMPEFHIRNWGDPALLGGTGHIDYAGARIPAGSNIPSHSLSESAEYQDYRAQALRDLYWEGCKLVGSNFNMESSQTVDGGPVVEYYDSSPYKYVVADTDGADGMLLTSGEGIGEVLGEHPTAIPEVNTYVQPDPLGGTVGEGGNR